MAKSARALSTWYFLVVAGEVTHQSGWMLLLSQPCLSHNRAAAVARLGYMACSSRRRTSSARAGNLACIARAESEPEGASLPSITPVAPLTRPLC
jgi:hypothetical protein